MPLPRTGERGMRGTTMPLTSRRLVAIDGNEAAARVAHRLSEVIAIYPITPSSTLGELADAWSAAARPNLWGSVPPGGRDAERGWRGRRHPRRAPGGRPVHDLHGVPGPAADA